MTETFRRAESAEVKVGAYLPTATSRDAATASVGATDMRLWSAVARAADTCRSAAAQTPVGWTPEEISAGIGVICRAWRREADGLPPEPSPGVVVDPSTVGRIRTAFLAEVRRMPDAPDAGELARMLLELESVARRLEDCESTKFRAAFAGPSALSLVVEVCHDMRSPLAAILLLTDTLRNGAPSRVAPAARQQAGLAYSAAFGLHAMVNDVIAVAHRGDRLFDPAPTSFSVTDIMQSVADIVRPMAEEKGLALEVVLPAVDSRMGHPLALSRVLVNLTTNALKFTRVGSVRMVARETSRHSIEFSVEDTGVGIPASVTPVLFEAFRRLRRGSTTANTFSSAGLGLNICRRLVRTMGSDLRVESEEGRGTRFAFEVALPPSPQTI